MLIEFNLEVLKATSYSKLYEIKESLELLLDLQTFILNTANESNDILKSVSTTKIIDTIKVNQSLLETALDYKVDEIVLDLSFTKICLN